MAEPKDGKRKTLKDCMCCEGEFFGTEDEDYCPRCRRNWRDAEMLSR